jgi:hypothetical protein
MKVRLAPIDLADAPRVGTFLHTHLNPRVTADAWAEAMHVPWAVEQPNAGFMLLDEAGEIVGAHLAFYARRTIDGREEAFCNLGAWCVLEEHRFHSLRLLKALLAQPGYTFTDLSPSGNVVKVNERLKFAALDTATALVPNLPYPALRRRPRVVTDPARIEAILTGEDLRLYRDHQAAAAARHVVLVDGAEHCYVVYRRDRRRNLPLFATLLHVSNDAVYRRTAPALARHLLRRGALATLAEERVTAHRPRLARRLATPRRKMFKSPHLAPRQIDYFYSELVCVAW